MCGVDEDAGVLRGDNGLDDGGEIVDVGKSFDTEDDVVKRGSGGVGGLFGSAHDYESMSIPISRP